MQEIDLDNFVSSSVIVIGDIMLDKYIYGTVNRLTPDAPVAAIEVHSEISLLGGAGNVVNHLSALKIDTYFIGICGKDENKKEIENLLTENRVNYYLFDFLNKTTAKINIIGERSEAERQKIARLDFGEIKQLSREEEDEIILRFGSLIKKCQAVVISDYAKGVCSARICEEVMKLANHHSIPVIVDPKGDNWEKYRGATLVKPNLSELSLIKGCSIQNGDSAVEDHGRELLNKFNLKYLLVTRSQCGMSLILQNEITHLLPTAKKIIDVSGAGDIVVATISACLAANIPIMEAINIANTIVGISISSPRAKLNIEQLKLQLKILNRTNKIIEISDLKQRIQLLRDRGKKIIFTNGFFDIIRKENVEHLRQARELGDVLIVGLNDDLSASRQKIGLSNSVYDRALILSSIEYVDYIVIFDDKVPNRILKAIVPDIIVKGGNYTIDQIIGKNYAKQCKILSFIPPLKIKNS